MGLSRLDREIAENYAEKILTPTKYGENGVYFWFPGSGMTTIVRDIFSDKTILKNHLSGLSSRIKVFQFWGHLTDKKSAKNLMSTAGFDNYKELEDTCKKALEKGDEIVCIIGRIDNYPQAEKIKILKMFTKLSSLNHRRIHINLHLIDKPWFTNTLKKNPEFCLFANNLEIMPVIDGKLLKTYIKTYSDQYNFPINKSEMDAVADTYGGILQVTKEYLRSHGSTNTLELKIKILWDLFPAAYQTEILNSLSSPKYKMNKNIEKDLEEMGIKDLKLFEKHQHILNHDPKKVLPKLLTSEELSLYKYCQTHLRQVVDKEKVIEILRPKNSDDVSFWAIDQAISRFRKKLAKAGIDPELLKTIKGKGYVWQE